VASFVASDAAVYTAFAKPPDSAGNFTLVECSSAAANANFSPAERSTSDSRARRAWNSGDASYWRSASATGASAVAISAGGSATAGGSTAGDSAEPRQIQGYVR